MTSSLNVPSASSNQHLSGEWMFSGLSMLGWSFILGLVQKTQYECLSVQGTGLPFPGTFQTGSFPPSCWPATFLPIQHASITVLLLGFRCRALSLEWVPKSMTNSTVAHLSLQCHFPLLNHIFVGFLNSGQLRARIQSKKNPINLGCCKANLKQEWWGENEWRHDEKWPLALTSHLPYILTCLIFWQHPISTCPPHNFHSMCFPDASLGLILNSASFT